MEPRGAQAWLPSKLASLDDALKRVVDGAAVALGGMTLYRRPVGAAVGLIERGARDLTLIDFTAGYEADILIGAGCVSRVRTSFFGLDLLGLPPMYREALAGERLEVVTESQATFGFGLRATLARTDYAPARIWGGTEMLSERPDLRLVGSPYSDEQYIAVPALQPDVTIIHAWKADAVGNAVLPGELAFDQDLAAASRETIVTAEHIVPTAEIEGHGADLLGVWVDAVVELPRGAWPTSCHPDYRVDLGRLADYVEACRAGGFEAFVGAPPAAGRDA